MNPQDVEDHCPHCFFECGTAYKFPGRVDWEGRIKHMASEDDQRIGLLLDLDRGTMNIFIDDEWCGVLADRGSRALTGGYTWAIGTKNRGQGGRIDPARFELIPTLMSGIASTTRRQAHACFLNEAAQPTATCRGKKKGRLV